MHKTRLISYRYVMAFEIPLEYRKYGKIRVIQIMVIINSQSIKNNRNPNDINNIFFCCNKKSCIYILFIEYECNFQCFIQILNKLFK